MNTLLTRRRFLQSAITLGSAAPLASSMLAHTYSTHSHTETWLCAQGKTADAFSLSWITPDTHKSQQVLSGFRGHGLCQNPVKSEQVIMFSRRPDTTGLRMNIFTGDIDHIFHSEPNHHMQGHGCYSNDGQCLFYTESNYLTGQGKITVRDANTLALINHFDSYGIGPHEIAMMPDGETLVVANGGLRTHPTSGRNVLNLDTMQSSLVYINARTGTLKSKHTLVQNKASIRHLDVAHDGTVAIALQVQRIGMNHQQPVPLAAVHKPGENIRMLTAPSVLLGQLNDYIGSVKIHNGNRIAAFTSPKGDMALFWHLDNYTLLGHHLFHDVCGLTLSADEQYFVMSNSSGKLRQINARNLKENKHKRLYFADKQWDNHMITLSPQV